MESLYLLIPLSLVIVAAAIWIFLRASTGGQFDDLDSPAHSILLDDDRPKAPAGAGAADGAAGAPSPAGEAPAGPPAGPPRAG